MYFKNPMFALFIFITVGLSPQLIYGQSADVTVKEETSDSTETKKDSTKKEVTIADKVKKSRKIEGLFTFYQDTITGKLQMYVRNDQISQEFIYQSFSMGGPPALFLNQNMLRQTWVFRIDKLFDKVHFTRVNTNFYFEPGKAISKAANADVSDARFYATKVIAKDSTGCLIEVDKLFLSTLMDEIKPNYPPSAKPVRRFNLGNLDVSKSYYSKVRSFPNNSDVLVSLSFDNPKPSAGGGNDITDARYVEVKMQHSLIQMPKNNYQPRFDDPRVGYFTEEKNDMSSLETINYHDLIHRWHLEKKYPDQDLSEPVEPIVWWVENTTPKEYVNIIVDAGHKWNEAFEKAGFKNAVQMKVMPDTATWDPADIRYNVIRWVSSDLGFAIGPSFVNPRTGQILGADITIDLGMLKHTLNEEALSEAAYAPHQFENMEEFSFSGDHTQCSIGKGLQMQHGAAYSMISLMPNAEIELKKLSEQFITELVIHEMGHTFGLGHNMKASNMLSPEDIHNTEITRVKGLTASIMDYTAVNIHSDPSKQGDYYSVKTGPYDWWAIEYGYTPFADGEEESGLKKILGKSSDPELDYGNDSDITRPGSGIDPRVMVWDQSSDIVSYATDRFKLVDNSMAKLRKTFVSDEASYQELFNKFYYLQRHRYSMASAVSAYIGGIYVNRLYPGQASNALPYTPVPASYQKKAMQFLAAEIFAPDAFEADRQLYPYLQRQRRGWNFGGTTEDPKLQNYVSGIHATALGFILHPVTLSRANTSSLYGNQYSTGQIISDLEKAIFEADMDSAVSLFRRNLQFDFVNRLISIQSNKSKRYDPTTVAVVYKAMGDLSKKLKKARKKGDELTMAHRENLILLINKSLSEN
jgi:hypothetical protein